MVLHMNRVYGIMYHLLVYGIWDNIIASVVHGIWDNVIGIHR